MTSKGLIRPLLAFVALVGIATAQDVPQPIKDALKRADDAIAKIIAVPDKDRTFDNTLGALDEINIANVKNLKLVFSRSTGVLRGHEAAPVVAGGMMFIVTPYPNVLLALDLTRPIRHPLGLKRRRVPALPANPAANP